MPGVAGVVKYASRAAVVTEWFREGIWAKVLDGDPSHRDIVASVPFLTPQQATVALKTLGLVEGGIGLWVLSGKRSTQAAVVQTALVVGMNAGGLLFGRDHIPEPKKLLVRNAGFLGLVWLTR